jgi:hypothetical protein
MGSQNKITKWNHKMKLQNKITKDYHKRPPKEVTKATIKGEHKKGL